jgi:crotonobetainyl-CoA:carnitine CoA-transferase CaiB-like acyl-CoA transferase
MNVGRQLCPARCCSSFISRFDGEGPAASQAPSLLGEDKAKVLSTDIGLSDEQIDTLIAKGIVKAAG